MSDLIPLDMKINHRHDREGRIGSAFVPLVPLNKWLSLANNEASRRQKWAEGPPAAGPVAQDAQPVLLPLQRASAEPVNSRWLER